MSKSKYIRKKPGSGILPNLPDETMTPGRMRVGGDGFSEAKKHDIERNGSTVDFRSGLPIGNGDFGAMIHGFPDNYTYHIAKNDLWWDDFDSNPPCYADCGIQGIREKVLAGDASVKHDIYMASSRRNNQPIQTSAARLTFHFLSGGTVACVREKLSISTGFVNQTFNCGDTNGIINGNNFSVTSNISHVDDIMQIYCEPAATAGSFGMLSFELTRDPMEVSANIGILSPEEIARREEEIDKYYSPECFVDGDYYGFNMRLRAGQDPENSPDVHYTVLMQSSCKDFKVVSTGTSLIAKGRTPKGGLHFWLTVVSTHDAQDTLALAKSRLARRAAEFPGVVGGNGFEWFAHNWRRSWIRLPDTRMSMPWYWGIYEAFSARRPGKFAPGYVAPWYQSCYANWGYHILTYEQTKSNLGLLANNHAELLECWFALCKNSREKLRAFTKDFYGMEGVCYPHAISGTGTVIASSHTLNSTIMNIQTAGETVKYAWDYFDFTQDFDYLREVGYPILKDVALFYSDYLLTEDDGTKVIFPSRTQELASPVGLSDEFMRNSIIDLSLFRFILTRTAQAAEILGIDKELAEKWLDDAEHLRSDYATYPNGVWKPSEDWDDRTMDCGVPSVSDLAPIVLTDEVDKWRGSPELRLAAEKSAKALVKDGTLPWDLSFGIIGRLRMGDKEYAKTVLELLPKSREGGNLNRSDACDFTPDNEMKPDGQQDFFVDKGSAVFSEIIAEMLLQSQGGIIRVFPAYPEEMGDAAFWSLRARGAFLVGSEMRNKKIAYAIIRSLKGKDCVFANPFGKQVRVRNLETGEQTEFSADGENIRFMTVPGHEYVVESSNASLESFPFI